MGVARHEAACRQSGNADGRPDDLARRLAILGWSALSRSGVVVEKRKRKRRRAAIKASGWREHVY
jgi:hypothetical protein